MRRLQVRKREVELDISPLIDVVFLLLIFFMVSTTFVEKPGLQLDLPEASTASPVKVDEILIQMEKDGAILLNGKAVSLADIEQKLQEAAADQPDVPVYLAADKAVPHGSVVKIIDAVRRSGLRGLSIAADTLKEDR